MSTRPCGGGGSRSIYGDISHPETLLHAGVTSAQILICTVPDALLKGTTNAKLVRHLREINPEAKIIAVADILADVTTSMRPVPIT